MCEKNLGSVFSLLLVFDPLYARVGLFFSALKNIKILGSKNFDACQIKKTFKILKYYILDCILFFKKYWDDDILDRPRPTMINLQNSRFKAGERNNPMESISKQIRKVTHGINTKINQEGQWWWTE